MKEKLLNYLCCPKCESDLKLKIKEIENGEIKTGEFVCSKCSNNYKIFNYVPRFVETDKYTGSYSLEWNLHRRTQLDSDSGTTESQGTFITKTGFNLKDLKGKVVFEAGCGSGRFLEIASNNGAEVIGVDLSYAVDAAQKNFGLLKNVHIVQADIFNLPFKRETCDYVYSIGVLMATPDTKQAFMKLPPLLKKGGQIAIWVYSKCHHEHLPDFHYRKITTKLPKKLLYLLSYLAVPFYYLKKIPVLRSFVSIYMRTSNHPNWRWRVLETFDWYSSEYIFTHTCYEVIKWFKEAGLKEIELLEFPVAVRGKKND
ncbi:MAG: methyltransferase domain-containing protein [bacterium]